MSIIEKKITVQQYLYTAAQATAAKVAAQAARDTALNAVASLQPLLDDLAAVLEVQGDLVQLNTLYDIRTELLAVHGKLTEITTIESKLTEIEAVYAVITEITGLYNSLVQLLNIETNINYLLEIHGYINPLNELHNNLTALLNIEAYLTVINTISDDLDLNESSKIKIVSEKIADINTAADNITLIQAAPGHALTAETQANIATDKASEAAVSANESKIIVFKDMEVTIDYTLIAADAGKYIQVNKATPVNITVPSNVFSAQQVVTIEQAGVGKVTLAEGSGMTLTGNLNSFDQYTVLQLVFKSANLANIIGGSND